MGYKIIKFFLPEKWIKKIKGVIGIKHRLVSLERNQRNLLWFNYKPISNNLNQKTIFRNREFGAYSQNGEDGLLLYIFSKIGVTNRCFVEFGIEEGKECNTANLSINFGWNGLLIEGNNEYVKKAKDYYKNKTSKVNIVHGFITKENINSLISDNGVKGKIDLLSIDIDGNDYWVWKEINVINPRVVVIEYNSSFGKEKSLTVKYDASFDIKKKHPSYLYHGASLKALTKLANSKGYVLVGCDSVGVNAFFVRKDAAKNKLSEISIDDAYYSQKERLKMGSISEQFNKIKHLDFKRV